MVMVIDLNWVAQDNQYLIQLPIAHRIATELAVMMVMAILDILLQLVAVVVVMAKLCGIEFINIQISQFF